MNKTPENKREYVQCIDNMIAYDETKGSRVDKCWHVGKYDKNGRFYTIVFVYDENVFNKYYKKGLKNGV